MFCTHKETYVWVVDNRIELLVGVLGPNNEFLIMNS